MDGDRKELGILAALGLGVCCGLPLLLGAATLAATGVLVGGLAAAAGIIALVVAVGRLARRRADRADACCPPSAARGRATGGGAGPTGSSNRETPDGCWPNCPSGDGCSGAPATKSS